VSRARLFGSLCGLVFLINFARIVFAPLLSAFIAEFPIREGTAGLIVTLVWIGSAASRMPTGWLLTRVARHRVVLGAGTVLAAASAFTATAGSVPALMAGAFCLGLASGVYFVAANPFVSELFPDRVGRALGVHGTASQLAAVAAAPVVTVTLAYGWRFVFVGLGVAAAALTAAVLVAARRADLPDAGRADTAFLSGARSQWRIVLVGVALLGLVGFVWQGVFNFYELYLRTKGLPPATARNALTVIFAAGVPAFLLSGRLADRFPHVPYVLSIIVAFVAGLAALILADGILQLLAVSAYLGLVIHAIFPAMDAYLLDTLPDESRGSAYAVYSGAMMLVQAGGSSVVGGLVERGLAYDAVFTAMAAGLTGLVVVLAGLQRAGRMPG